MGITVHVELVVVSLDICLQLGFTGNMPPALCNPAFFRMAVMRSYPNITAAGIVDNDSIKFVIA